MQLPPLYSLLCFAQAARHLSIKRAAEELHLTPAAVSQQVAKLEQAVGVELFIRSPRRINLTEVGRSYLRAIEPALRQIEQATARLRPAPGPQILTLSCTSGFAMQWLLPRLADFQTREPEVDVRINTTNRLVNLLLDDVDFAVRHGTGEYPDLEVERLLGDRLQAVCSPALLPGGRLLSTPSGLAGFTLLHDEHRADWALWLQAAGAKGVNASAGTVFIDSNGAIEAAVAGHGMALVRPSLVRAELDSGKLLIPFPHAVETPIAYYLVYDGTALLQPHKRRFHQWLTAQARTARNEFEPGRPSA
ncbi:transcriptional regulator GcvA [Massilia sp. BJB1822]|uniref:transcriptional regulator GcvA n=1 Tax=Massilia sp. BJB1822 TaxID=2744470 RepID=UPI001592DB77|nr:transcriptional regulator GcvA [Massilia sp. BJB1822]NVE01122.1 transcriptional regulator GcvA [Massilia sp. BJB1822]